MVAKVLCWTYALIAPSSKFKGVMSSSIACLGMSVISMPDGSSFSFPGDQNRLPGFGAEPLTTDALIGSVALSPASSYGVSWEGSNGARKIRTECILRPSVERRLRERRAGKPFKYRVCSFATDSTAVHRRRKFLVTLRRRHFVHALVRHVGMDHGGLHLAFESVQSLSQFLDVAALWPTSAERPFHHTQTWWSRLLPFAWTTFHGHATELTDNPEASTVRAGFHAGFRACIATDLGAPWR